MFRVTMCQSSGEFTVSMRDTGIIAVCHQETGYTVLCEVRTEFRYRPGLGQNILRVKRVNRGTFLLKNIALKIKFDSPII